MNETGHMLVSRIAWDKMTPTARVAVQKLTADPHNPTSGKPTTDQDNDQFTAATWMDDIRPTYAGLHFVNTEIDSDGTLPAGPNGVTFAEQNIAVLKDKNAGQDEKAESLRLLMHLVGDLHQPLHCSDNHDRGGNQFALPWNGSPKGNLHSFWDSGGGQWKVLARPLTDQGQAQLGKMAADLEQRYPMNAQASDLNPADWAHEGFELAKKDCYTGVVQGQAPSDDYRRRAADDMNREAALAGYRLANLANSIFTG